MCWVAFWTDSRKSTYFLASHVSNNTLPLDHHLTATMPNLPDLPCELRLELYGLFFDSLPVTTPEGDLINTECDLIRDARPLLATSRQVAGEAIRVAFPKPAIQNSPKLTEPPYSDQGWFPSPLCRRRRCDARRGRSRRAGTRRGAHFRRRRDIRLDCKRVARRGVAQAGLRCGRAEEAAVHACSAQLAGVVKVTDVTDEQACE